MRRSQILGVLIALGAGGVAFLGMRSVLNAPPKTTVKVEKADTTAVLVANADMALGEVAQESSFRWQEWPATAVSGALISRQDKPAAAKDFAGAIVRAPIVAGEPVTPAKLIRPGSGGVLAAILPPGMRAVSTKITEYTAAGKLILPNDHVDVILIRRTRNGGQEGHASEILFRNVRVLAIGQQIGTKDGKKSFDGNVATLQLTPRQAELLALANSTGEISLALRSIADLGSETDPTAAGDLKAKHRNNSVSVMRYGAKSQVYGIN